MFLMFNMYWKSQYAYSSNARLGVVGFRKKAQLVTTNLCLLRSAARAVAGPFAVRHSLLYGLNSCVYIPHEFARIAHANILPDMTMFL